MRSGESSQKVPAPMNDPTSTPNSPTDHPSNEPKQIAALMRDLLRRLVEDERNLYPVPFVSEELGINTRQ